ncbi:flagellar basal-body MS-ring/collar protein FliF [Frigoribacterium sp. VKM Ac-2836]|uniref:flagellar basal-body MS-ring/collar protein FliF n=1 Tax=Frigoribacterium sp. VKM Ac-2836 TaxID=2739014 RepID=UPI001564EF15|nr:flagellar basal-body MS-ring/collar protein FliF [Frigoribacterium sp. VKM Ac-2836]NRD26628.1 flagellar M-ring protein FliF [Frigoribacterium sp. VKM Ac-2836]
MPTAVKGQLAKLGAALQSFTVAQRTIAVILLAALVLGVVALVSWLGKPTYTPLFSGIDPTDASAIVELLQTDGVPYELTAGGGTILVPEANVYDERLKAAAAGLPAASSGGGYSLLDTMGVTSSEFQQNVTYKRAIEGELANTIKAMDGVKNASVQLAIPEDSVFVSEQRDPTASVFVETRAGATLDSKQVQAIVNLTSASVEGMKATDVAVTDASGTVLSAVGSGAVGGAGGDASDYESKVQASVQAMLDKMVGPGNSSVVVAADLDQSSGTKVTESFSQPESGPIALNESGTTEQYGSGANGANGTGATGVLGPDNIAVPTGTNGTTTAGTGADGGYTNESTTKNNAVDKVTESLAVPAGEVSRQTVSVALNSAAANGVNMQSVRDLVGAAAGIDAARGDTVQVAQVDFDTSAADAAAEALKAADAASASEAMWGTIRTVGIVAAIAIAAIVGLIVFARRSRRQDREDVDLGELAPQNGAQTWDATMPLSLDDAVATSRLTLPGMGEPKTELLDVDAPTPSPEFVSAERRRAEIDAMAERDPGKTAELLRGLMDDRQPA